MKAKVIGMAAALLLVGWMAGTARADFVKMGSEHLDVTISHDIGILYDTSTADILAGGYIGKAYVNDNAMLTVRRPSGAAIGDGYLYNNGRIEVFSGSFAYLRADDASTANLSGGGVSYLSAMGTSNVDISGGTVSYLGASQSSAVDISGGSVSSLSAEGTSPVTFHGYDFRATAGLSLLEFDVIDGVPQYEVIGTGLLTGKWRDGTTWITTISTNYSTATILAVPEPATLAMLALGGLAVLRRRPNRPYSF